MQIESCVVILFTYLEFKCLPAQISKIPESFFEFSKKKKKNSNFLLPKKVVTVPLRTFAKGTHKQDIRVPTTLFFSSSPSSSSTSPSLL